MDLWPLRFERASGVSSVAEGVFVADLGQALSAVGDVGRFQASFALVADAVRSD